MFVRKISKKKDKELLKHVKELEKKVHELENRVQEEQCVVIEDYTCNICMDSKKTHAFNMCGHLCVCKDCGDKCVDVHYVELKDN